VVPVVIGSPISDGVRPRYTDRSVCYRASSR
jgi:hypothetical protein